MSRLDEPFIFVSYSRKNSDFVYPEMKRLERQGYKIWYDKGEIPPSSFWSEEIRKAIEECSCFIVFITQFAVESEQVCEEIAQALKASKPFICIYWEKVELPARFQKTIRSIQVLERYSLHKLEYEEPLGRALSEYIKRAEPSPEESQEGLEKAPVLPSPVPSSGELPKIIYFILILLAVVFFFFAIVTAATTDLASLTPTDPSNNRLVRFLSMLFFIILAAGLGVAAFLVRRKYLREKTAKINPHRQIAHTLAFVCYIFAGLVLVVGIFFTCAAATVNLSEMRLEGVTNQQMTLITADMFLVIVVMIILFGRRVQVLFGQQRRVEKLAAKSTVGCLNLGALGCGLWSWLSIHTTLITGKILSTGEPASYKDIFVGSSGATLLVFVMLAFAWFISANYLRLKSEERRRAYQAYLDLIQPKLHKLAEPETRAYVQEQTIGVLTKLDTSLKGTLLDYLSKSDLLAGNTRIDLRGADFRSADLRLVSLPRANLREMNLEQAALQGAMLFEAILYKAKLKNADLSRANLQGANLQQADLSGAVLEGTNLHEANLAEANVTTSQLKKARLEKTVLPDGTISS